MVKTHSASRPYGGVSHEQRRTDRYERFMQAGLRVFGRNGYAATTTRNLCAEAGLTQRYFYESFRDLEELFITIITRLGRELDAAILQAQSGAGTPEDRARASLTAYLEGIQRDPNIGRILLIELYAIGGQTAPMARAFNARQAELLQLALESSFPQPTRKGVNTRLLAIGFVGATHHIALSWVVGGYSETIEELVEALLRIFRTALVDLGLSDQAQPRSSGTPRPRKRTRKVS
jgi:AcrR family transcriptional regulator